MQEAEGSGSTQNDGGTCEKGHYTSQDSDSIQDGVVRSEENRSGESLAGLSRERETVGESRKYQADGSSLQSDATHREEGTLDMTASAETTKETGLSCVENSECTDALERDSTHGSKADIELEETVGVPQEDVKVVSKSLDKPFEEKKEVLSGGQTTSFLSDTGSVDLYQLAEVLRELKEEDYRFLFSLGPSAFKAELRNFLITRDGFADSLEQLKEQLYVSNVAKDFLSLQLAEQSDLQMEFDTQNNQLQNEAFNLRCLLSESVESSKTLSEELGQCRTELQAVSAGKEDLEAQFRIAKSEVEEISFRSTELQMKLERSNEELTNLMVELAQCKDLLEALQTENSTLNGNLISVADERMMLEEGKEYLVHENEKLSTQLIEHQERFAAECAKHVQLEIDLKEAMLHIEQLTEVNIVLSSNLNIHRAKVEEIKNDNAHSSSQARDITDHQDSTHVPILFPSNAVSDACSHQSTERCEDEVTSGLVGKSTTLTVTDEPALRHIETEDVDNSAELDVLDTQFKGAKMILQKLEKAIEGMQSHSVSLSMSSSKVPAPGVSKLIQAFEKSKVQHEDNEAESVQVAEEQPAFKSAKEQTRLLRVLLAELNQNSNKANELFMEEQKGRKIANLALIELEDLYGASKRYSDHMEAKNDQLVNTLIEYESRMEELLTHLYGIEQNAHTVRDVILNEVEIIQKEMVDKTNALEKEWNSTVATVSDMVDKLDACTSSQLTPTSSTVSSLNVVSRVVASVNAAIEVIGDLHKKLEVAYKNHEETRRSYEDLHKKLEASYKDHDATRSSSEDLCKKFEAAYTDNEAIRSTYEELNEKFSDLNSKKELAVGILQTIYGDLKELVISSLEDGIGVAEDLEDKTSPDPLQHDNCKQLIERLGKLLEERLLLKSANKELVSAKDELESEKSKLESTKDDLESTKNALEVELVHRKHDVDVNPILKLVEDVEAVLQVQDIERDLEVSPASHLESLVASLIQNYTNASQQVSLLREDLDSNVTELSDLQGKLHQLSSLDPNLVDETQTLKEKIKKMDADLEAVRVELQTKGAELEQSENRVNSIREKLSIAVAKGKGLIVQRDSLKQSLSEMSTELERCSMELQLKESRLYDVQTKLKSYSEAGERVEALESELSYIRNSATALRESFLVKDSALQRIEEILEDIDLPEHFHPRDIVEKIEWLARSVAGNSVPATDWDQKSSGGGGFYSDAGFVVMENWKEDVQSSSNSGLDEQRRNYEELQGKFYGLAEQNEMLEQSLMERNNLVQRWEEVLDRIDMPLHLRSVEPEDRIEWLGQALSEAHHDRNSLHQKINNYETYCDSLTAALEESKRKVSDHEEALQGLAREKEVLAENLESLTLEYEKVSDKFGSLTPELERVSEKAIQFELEKDRLLTEITDLREKLVDKAENKKDEPQTEDCINRFQVLISEALQEGTPEPEVADSCTSTDRLEGSLRKLIDNYMALSLRKHVLQDTYRESVPEDTFGERGFGDVLNSKEKDTVLLKEELEEALVNLTDVKEEKDKILEKYHSLIVEFESLGKRNDDLQVRLNQEEQKVVAAREKLNVAVRKGKALVQQRDSLKQNIDVLNTEVERLKGELNQREGGLVLYEQKVRDLSVYPEKVEALERESVFLKNRLAETEHNLLDSRQTLARLCDVVNSVDVGDGLNVSDPVHKLEGIGKVCYELQAAVASSENESKKSRRSAELLAAELNEVQERADNLQEDLAQAEAAFLDLAKERDLVDTARVEALSRLEKFTALRSEERKKELMEIMKVKAGIDQLKKGCFGFTDLLVTFFAMDLELLRSVETGFQAFLQQKEGTKVEHQLSFTAPCCVLSKNSVNEVKFPATGSLEELSDDHRVIEVFGIVGHGLQDCIREIDDLSERLYKHSMSSDQRAKGLFKDMESVYREIGSQKDCFELMRSNISNLESVAKEKETDIISMHKNFKLLYEACNNSILEIENCNSQIGGNGLPSEVCLMGKMVDLKLPISIDGREPVDRNAPFTEECIRTMADTLLSSVKKLTSFQLGTVESSQKELKTTISNLQNALQDKDVQGNQICTELVSQIKEAEAIANNYLIDLESSKTQVHNLEKQVETLQGESNALESRLKELQDVETSSKELHDRINSLTGDITRKEQEIEALLQALDEEESQMEELTNRNEELENLLQQKSHALENLEVSRGKAMAKLSTTVSKFEELRQLSESLVSEVENLQSQVQSRDEEISFLRQEVTRCTSDVLSTSHESSRRKSNEMHELFTWLNLLVSRLGVDLKFDDKEWNGQIQACKEVFEKEITSVVSEVEDLRVIAQSKEALLQVERTKVEELQHRRESLETSLHEKDLQLASLLGARGPGETPHVTSSEIVEVEPTINKRGVAGASVPLHVRSLRKGNSDQVAIAIDMDQGASALIDDDDDKVHGFKSLTTSRFVPRFTRPVSDMVDGLWVSYDRAMMRQPALRLGIILYWFVVHSILAASIV